MIGQSHRSGSQVKESRDVIDLSRHQLVRVDSKAFAELHLRFRIACTIPD